MGRANIRHGFPSEVVQIHSDCGCGVSGRGGGVRGAGTGRAERPETGPGGAAANNAGPTESDAVWW